MTAPAPVERSIEGVSRRLSRSRARLVATLAIAFFCLLALHPLLDRGYGDGHDAWIYPTRFAEFEKALLDGQLPPVWSASLGRGHGQPHFQFAPPLLYGLGAALRPLGVGIGDALELPLAILFSASAAAVYRISRRRRASRIASVGAAVAWLFAPYVALDLYVRAAHAEAAAIACTPIALLFVLRLRDRPGPLRLAAAAFGTALVLLAHNAIALLFVGAVLVVGLLRPLRGFTAVLAGVGYSLGLSAFFWLPALVERRFVKIERLRGTVSTAWDDPLGFVGSAFAAAGDAEPSAVFERHAIAPWQLIWSPWEFGNSRYGTADDMSFAIGGVHLVLAALAGLAAWRARDRECLTFLALAASGAWLATTTSIALWNLVPVLQYLAFPWRALFLPALFLPLALPAVFDRIGTRGTIAAILALVLWNLPHVGPWRTVRLDDASFAPEAIARTGKRATSVEEYAPRWSFVGTPHWPDRVRAPDGAIARLEEIERSGIREVHLLETTRDTIAWVAPFYYPGWRAWIDEREVRVVPARGTGTLEVRLPEGTHRLRIEFGPTRVRFHAVVASAGAWILLLGFVAVDLLRPAPRVQARGSGATDGTRGGAADAAESRFAK
jgi:hypothetical protein